MEHASRLSPCEREALATLCAARPRHVGARRHVVREGDAVSSVPLLLKGWACTYRHLEDGRWQIFSVLLPGDLCAHEPGAGRVADYSLRTVGEAIVVDVPLAALAAVAAEHPGLGLALASAAAVQASIVRERVMSLGQRKALECCAHLVCELFWRLRAVGGTAVGDVMDFPLTQEEVGSLIGVSTVHANRMLQDLRAARMISQVGRRLRVLDLPRLEALAMFSPEFLGLGRDPVAPSARRPTPPIRHLPPAARREPAVARPKENRMMRKAFLFAAAAAVMRFPGGVPEAAAAGAGDYRLGAGDVLEFAVAGMPDLGRKAQIDVDGTVSLPLAGEVKAAGLPLTELRAKVRSLVSQKEVRVHAPGGARSEGTEVVWPDQVSLSVAEYRPVYLDGDVAKPGAEPFRPGMDVRQAVSLAGGYDILRFRMENPFLTASDIRGSYEAAWIEFARDQAALSRVRSELSEAKAVSLDPAALSAPPTAARPVAKASADAGPASPDLATDPPVAPGLLASIRSAESALKGARDVEFDQKRAHAAALVRQDDQSLAVLVKRRDTEDAGSKYDDEEFKRIEGVFKQGAMPMTRVADARRIMLLSATQALASGVEVERAATEREVHLRDAAAVVTDRRVELLHAQVDAQLKLADDRVRIQALGDKLLYTGALKSQLVRGTGGAPDVSLFRDGAPARPVGEGETLRPGDVLVVSLHAEGVPAGASTLR